MRTRKIRTKYTDPFIGDKTDKLSNLDFPSNPNVIRDAEDMDPDSIYKDDSITFVYDHKDNILFYGIYPVTHFGILNSNDYIKKGKGYYEILYNESVEYGGSPDTNSDPQIKDLLGFTQERKAYRDDAIRNNYLLGRIGEIQDEDQSFHCIGFWNKRNDDAKLKLCIKSIIKKFPYLNKSVIFWDTRFNIKPITVQNLNINAENNFVAPQKKLTKPECKPHITVDGKPMDFNQILSNLHMVKGTDMDKIKGSFCAKEPELRSDLQRHGCDLNLLNAINAKMNCQSKDLYNQLKKDGKFAYKSDLRDIFAKGDLNQFRTQKELDAAWDYLKKEHKLSFKEWIHETQCGKST